MNTVNDLIKKLNNLPNKHKDKPITIFCPNGLRVFPTIKYKRVDKYDFTSPIEEIVLTWD